MKYFVDFPRSGVPGEFVVDDVEFDTRKEAVAYCEGWGAVDGKLDLITEFDDGDLEEAPEEESPTDPTG